MCIFKNTYQMCIRDSRIGKMEGRGAYICDNIECLERVKKSKRLERVLDINISDEIYESLRGVILGK